VEDLPLIEQLVAYRHTGDVALLRALQREELFAAELEPLATDAPAEPEARLASMSAADKAELQRQAERLRRLTDEEQNRLRKLEHALSADPQGARLREVMARYQEWFRGLNSTQRTELLSLPPEQRVPRIKSLMDEQERQRFQELLAVPLQPEDQRVLASWVNELLRDNEQRLLEQLPPLERQRLRQVEDSNRRMLLLIAAFRFRSGPTTRLLELMQPTEEQLLDLRKRLSPQSRAALDSARDAAERRLVVQSWLRAALESRLGPPVNKDELQRFWDEEITAEQREYLESLPRDRMKVELQRLYQRQHFNKLRLGQPPFNGAAPRRGDDSRETEPPTQPASDKS
jgi:hypothetical protein